MSKYFSQFLPVEGEIKKNDYLIDPTLPTLGIMQAITDNEGKLIKNRGGSKVILFVCSKDIQVGDKIDGEISVRFHSPKLVVADGETGPKEGNWGNISIFRDPYKIIGEVSPEATWVKNGDVFDEIKYYCINIDAFGEWDSYIFSEEEFKKRDMKPLPKDASIFGNSPRGMWFRYIKVKGPCGHFH